MQIIDKSYFSIRNKFPPTDFEKFSDFLNEYGIGHTLHVRDVDDEEIGLIWLESGAPRVNGNDDSDFVAFYFDGCGGFTSIGIGV